MNLLEKLNYLQNFTDMENNQKKKIRNEAYLLGAGIAVPGIISNTASLYLKNFKGKDLRIDNEVILKKLIEDAKKNGIDVNIWGEGRLSDPKLGTYEELRKRLGVKNIDERLPYKDIWKKRGYGSTENIGDFHRFVLERGGPHYMPTKGAKKFFKDDPRIRPTINLGKVENKHLKNMVGDGIDAEILSHELGHAKGDLRKSGKINNVLQKLRTTPLIGGYAGTLATSAGTAYVGKKLGDKIFGEGSTGSNIMTTGGAITGGLVNPMTLGEASASVSGLRELKRLGASKQLISRSRKNLLKALSSYGGGGLVLAAPVAATAYYLNNKNKQTN